MSWKDVMRAIEAEEKQKLFVAKDPNDKKSQEVADYLSNKIYEEAEKKFNEFFMKGCVELDKEEFKEDLNFFAESYGINND